MAPGPRGVVAGYRMLAGCPELPWYPVARYPMLSRHPVLARYPELHRYPVLAGTWVRGRLKLLPIARRLPDPDAFADPERAGAKHAPKLASAWHIEALTGAQCEVFVIAGQVADAMTGAAGLLACRGRVLACGGVTKTRPAVAGSREPVVRVRPGSGLLRIRASRTDALRKFGQLVPATLANCGERYRVPRQIQRDLVWLPGPIAAAHCLDGQH